MKNVKIKNTTISFVYKAKETSTIADAGEYFIRIDIDGKDPESCFVNLHTGKKVDIAIAEQRLTPLKDFDNTLQRELRAREYLQRAKQAITNIYKLIALSKPVAQTVETIERELVYIENIL